MAGTETYTTYRYTVAAGAAEDIPATGAYVAILEANLASFDIRLDEDNPQEIQQGLTVQVEPGERFSKITIDNSRNGVDLAVFIAIGTGSLRDARLSLVGSLNVQTPTGVASVPDVALAAGVATQVLPVNANRKEALITNLVANALDIRVGDSDAGAARGVEVSPGQTIIVSASAAIYAYSAAAQTVAVVEVVQ